MKSSFLKKNTPARSKRGFSLFETLIAIFILMFAVAGAMSLVQKSLSSEYYSRDQVMASFLAQDAIEYIRNVRDHNFIITDTSGIERPWLDDLGECDGTCRVDTTKVYTDADAIVPCLETCDPLNFDPATGLYSYDSSASPSRFTRTVTLSTSDQNPDLDADEVEIDVTVSWKTGALALQSQTVHEYLRDWAKIDDSGSIDGGGLPVGGGFDPIGGVGGSPAQGGTEQDGGNLTPTGGGESESRGR